MLTRAQYHTLYSAHSITIHKLSKKLWLLITSSPYSFGSVHVSPSTGWKVEPGPISVSAETAAYITLRYTLIITEKLVTLTGSLKRIFGDCTIRGFLKLCTICRKNSTRAVKERERERERERKRTHLSSEQMEVLCWSCGVSHLHVDVVSILNTL